jgi:hypothetical protein
MGVPSLEVGYTSATTGRGDHEVHKGQVVALENKNSPGPNLCGGHLKQRVKRTAQSYWLYSARNHSEYRVIKFTAEFKIAVDNVVLKGDTWLRAKGKVSVALSIWSVENRVGGPGSSVGIATGYGLDGPGIEKSWWEARFFAPVQNGSEAHPASCTMDTRSFPGVESGRGVTLTPHPLLVPRSKNRLELYPYSA